MSSDIVWQTIRNNSSFLVKRNGIQFSREPGNLTGLNSYKYNGLANNKTVSVEAAPGTTKTGAVIRKKNNKKANKPAKLHVDTKVIGGFRRVAAKISKETAGSHYRPDLEKAALARWTKIHRSQLPKRASKKPVHAKKGTKPVAK